MTDLAIRSEQQSKTSYGQGELTIELAKMLALVAPASMSADQQEMWLRAAADALRDIRTEEIRTVSTEVRRSVQHHNQIVPAIADKVAELRKRRAEQDRQRREDAGARLPRRKPHIADRRDRHNFTASDWAELNEYLERMGSPVRYSSTGTRL